MIETVILKNLVFHIADRKDWEKGRQAGSYTVTGTNDKGYIELFSKEEVIEKANKHYQNKKDLLLLYIDITLLRGKVKNKKIHGSLDTDAVIRIINLQPQPDGTYIIPPDLL